MKRLYFGLLAMLALTLACGTSTSREILPVTGQWYFQMDVAQAGVEQEWFAGNYAHTKDKPAAPAPDWDAYAKPNYDGWGWYFIDFSYPPRTGNIALHFQDVDDAATVWLNGTLLGKHAGAHREFKLDATEAIWQGVNRLAVLIEDGGGFGGLVGPVKLISFESADDLKKGTFADAVGPKHPEWSRNAVIYELNVRQFSEAGTFSAVEERLEELKDLGVSIIWFMPIHPIGEEKRKGSLGSYYSVRDFYGINPEFGTLADFERLVEKIHALDMKVIIDLVANHTAWDNPLITEHPDWYRQNVAGEIIAPVPDWSDVAQLNYDNPELRKYMIKMLEYWVGDVGIDGYRCDVAGMVPTDFWVAARQALDAIKPVFMLAEAETPELNAHGFDMTYASEMHWAFNRIAAGTDKPGAIAKLLEYEKWHYPKNSMRMRFTSNHDENTANQAAVTRMGLAAAKAGAVLTCTLPGTPLIYNGQEVGNPKALEFFERDPIAWRKSDFRELYQRLFAAYRNNPAFYAGDFTLLSAPDDDQLLAFERTSGKHTAVILVNLSNRSCERTLKIPAVMRGLSELFSMTKPVAAAVDFVIKLPAWGFAIYQ